MLATEADCCDEAVAMRSRGPSRAKSAAAAAAPAAAATTSPIRTLVLAAGVLGRVFGKVEAAAERWWSPSALYTRAFVTSR